MNYLFALAWTAAALLLFLEVTHTWRRERVQRRWLRERQREQAYAIVRRYAGLPPAVRISSLAPTADCHRQVLHADDVREAFRNIAAAHDAGELSDAEMDFLVNQLLDADVPVPGSGTGASA
jgi:hypothetical protein